MSDWSAGDSSSLLEGSSKVDESPLCLEDATDPCLLTLVMVNGLGFTAAAWRLLEEGARVTVTAFGTPERATIGLVALSSFGP